MKLVEGKLEFDFDEDVWKQLIKFDEHPDYTKIKNLVPETRGADFTGILRNDTFVAIEVKDFRGAAIGEKERDEPMEIEIAKKMVGTLATVLASARSSNKHSELWQNYVGLIQDEDKGVSIILWYEADPLPIHQKRQLQYRSNLQARLKGKLGWLKPKVLVCNLQDYNPNSLGLQVKSL